MIDEENDSEDFSESVLPVEVEEAAVPIPLTDILPWHHPRKQYVRDRQWRLYVEQLVNRLQDQDKLSGNVVKYLTLPGIDYFDVEILGQLAKDAGLELEATGFLAEAEKESIRARSQFRADSLIKDGLIKDTSITFPYRFEDLANRRSQAYRDIKARAPFLVVNIDACGSVARPTVDQPDRIINAIHELMNLQFSVGRINWVLFLTTDARSDNLSQDVREALKAAIRQNSHESQEFAQGAKSLLSTDNKDDIEQALSKAEASVEHFLPMFSLGFSKWILHNANNVGWDVKSRQFYCYSTRPENEDAPSMACLAFEFCPRPIIMADQFGAVNPQPIAEGVQTDFSMQALERAKNMDDLDELLRSNPELKKRYMLAQRELLIGAGYQAAALDSFDEKFS